MLKVQQRRSIHSRARDSRATAFARSGSSMKQKPDVLEHGWTRRSETQIAIANLTNAQAKEQVE
jgi:hypothetical protein